MSTSLSTKKKKIPHSVHRQNFEAALDQVLVIRNVLQHGHRGRFTHSFVRGKRLDITVAGLPMLSDVHHLLAKDGRE